MNYVKCDGVLIALDEVITHFQLLLVLMKLRVM